MKKEETHFFIVHKTDGEKRSVYRVEHIHINIPLTTDAYRPLSQPYHFLNLLCRTQLGYEFLREEKFLEHCLELVQNEETAARADFQ